MFDIQNGDVLLGNTLTMECVAGTVFVRGDIVSVDWRYSNSTDKENWVHYSYLELEGLIDDGLCVLFKNTTLVPMEDERAYLDLVTDGR